ncbi:NUDIX hydrolase [Pseudaminobacter sp. NGMCC 1.201702]|uniref:NUDIX hydrolase n=1 Tax=Pseudaminobacter sp. NGMCC 1.201702 TaxID=3391825 RepID=UPI0039EE3B5D
MLISHATRNCITEQIRRLFGGTPPRVQVAALPWRQREGGIEIMLITSRDTGRWVLPKGWPEAGEQLFESAAREAAEEAGISGEMAHIEAGRYFYGKVLDSGMERRCEVLVFPMEVDHAADDWPEKDERHREWFPAAEASRCVREQDLGELIAQFGASRNKTAT